MEIEIDDIRKLIIDKPQCCDKEMFRFDNSYNGIDTTMFVCLDCGHSLVIKQEQIDEDDLETYKEMAKWED
jgi:hypothetical protein